MLETGPTEPMDREVDITRRALSAVRARLPADWSMSDKLEARLGGRRVDALVEIRAPSGEAVTLVAECKRSLVARDVPEILSRLEDYRAQIDGPTIPVVIARYLSSSVRQRLEENGASYADATGNLRLTALRPALFLGDRGADKDPWRGPGRPRDTLKGVPAALVVRALTDCAPPMSVPDLVRVSGASTGATYRVVELLEKEGLVERASGKIQTVMWRKLLQRWSKDYSFAGAGGHRRHLAPRGLPALEAALVRDGNVNYALTGSLAARHWAPYAQPRLAMVYVDEPDRAAEAWDLRPVEAGANVVLAVPDSDVVYQRAVDRDGLTLAAPSQVVVDLLTGPGRSPSEANYLLDWMEAHEADWRA